MAIRTGRELTFGRALVGSLLLARAIRRRAPAGSSIGLLLPASVGGALAKHRGLGRRLRPRQPETSPQAATDGRGDRPLRHRDGAHLAHVSREGGNPAGAA